MICFRRILPRCSHACPKGDSLLLLCVSYLGLLLENAKVSKRISSYTTLKKNNTQTSLRLPPWTTKVLNGIVGMVAAPLLLLCASHSGPLPQNAKGSKEEEEEEEEGKKGKRQGRTEEVWRTKIIERRKKSQSKKERTKTNRKREDRINGEKEGKGKQTWERGTKGRIDEHKGIKAWSNVFEV